MNKMNDFEKECFDQVQRIAEHLDNLASGNSDTIDDLNEKLEDLEDDEPEEPDEDDFSSEDEYDKAYAEYEQAHDEWEAECDELHDQISEAEDETISGYFEDVLNLSYIVDANKDYESVRAWVTVGGPSIYVDTDECAVILNWGGTHAECGIRYDTRDAIDDYFRELYECF